VRALILSSRKSEGLELGRIRQKIPERVARRGDIARERRIFVLQERDHLENEKIKILAKFCERRPATPRVERAESLQQVVDVVLERQLGEHTDRMSVAQSPLERGQVDNRGSLLRRGRRSGTRSRARRLWRLGWSRCRRLRLRRLGPLGLGRSAGFGASVAVGGCSVTFGGGSAGIG
jgi:hypothetical protein